MTKVGDQSGFITWIMFYRWFLFGISAMIVLGLLGLLLQGVNGLLIGAVGGLITGVVLGKLVGNDWNLLPIDVETLASYASGDFYTSGTIYPGRVISQSFTDEEGNIVERRIVQYLKGFTLKKLSNYNLSVWIKNSPTARPKLKIMQVSDSLQLPVIVKNGVMVLKNVPVYATGDDGEVLLVKGNSRDEPVKFRVQSVYSKDKDGNLLKYVKSEVGEYVPDEKGVPLVVGEDFVRDENGELIPDKNGKYFPDKKDGVPIVVGETEQTVFDSRQMIENGKIATIPQGIAAAMDNERVEYTQQYVLATTFNKIGGWWARHGTIAIAAICIVGLVLIGGFTYLKISDVGVETAKAYAQANEVQTAALNSMSQNNRDTAILLAQVSNKLGVNTSAFVSAGSQGTAPQPSKSPSFQIPFVNGG